MIDCSVNGTPRGRAPYPEVMAGHPSHQSHRPLRAPRRPRRRPVRPLGGHARGQPPALPRGRRRRHRRARRRARPRARQAARPAPRRGDEGRPGPLDDRLHRDPRVRARGVQGHARRAARRRPAAAVQEGPQAARGGAGRPGRRALRAFEEEAFAAASIGQVHRAVTLDGDEVAVKLQYPGVAEAVESDLRNLSVLLPLVKRLAPGLDVKALYGELRERIAEELDYEIEAQNHRAVERAYRGHRPSTCRRSTPGCRAAACSSPTCSHGRRFAEVKELGEAERDRFGEIVFRFYFSLLTRHGARVRGPAPRQLPAARRRARRLPRLRAHAHARPVLPRGRAGAGAGGHGRGRRRGPRHPRPPRLSPRPRRLRARGAARVAAGGGRVVPAAGLPPALAPVRERADRLDLLPALAMVRAAAPADRPAAGAAHPAHGGARVLDARRAARGRRLVRAGERVLRRAPDRWSNIWTNAADRTLHCARSRCCSGHRFRRPVRL